MGTRKCGYNAPGVALAGAPEIPPDIAKIASNLTEMRLLLENKELCEALDVANKTIESQNQLQEQSFKELLDARTEIQGLKNVNDYLNRQNIDVAKEIGELRAENSQLKETVRELEDKVSESSQFGRWER